MQSDNYSVTAWLISAVQLESSGLVICTFRRIVRYPYNIHCFCFNHLNFSHLLNNYVKVTLMSLFKEETERYKMLSSNCCKYWVEFKYYLNVILEIDFRLSQMMICKAERLKLQGCIKELLISIPPKRDLGINTGFAWVKICEDSDSHLSKSSLSWGVF